MTLKRQWLTGYIRLAGQPAIESVEEPGKNGVADDPETGFRYIATFEVYPEFEPSYGDSIAVTRPVVEIVEADIDEMVESLRKQRMDYSLVDRAAADEDQVIMDFKGYIDDELFDGGSAEKAPLVLGSKAMIPGFEEQIVGVKAGDEKSIEVNFPETYQAEHLMERELGQRVDSQIKSQVMDGLVDCNEIEVPEALIVDEIGRQREQLLQQMPAGTDSSFLADELFREQAIKRVRLGLVVGEIIRRDERAKVLQGNNEPADS